MKSSHLNLAIFLTTVLLSGGCKKELNVFPTTAEVDGNAITDQQSAQTVLNGVYYRFADAGYDYDINATNVLWSTINEDFPSQLTGCITFTNSPDSSNLAPNDLYANMIWNYGYALVNAANGFIKNITSVTTIAAPAKQQMLAEARFLRAFGNSDLLLYFGQYNDPSSRYGIILRDTFVTSANINIPRSDVATAYTAILSDLDFAISGLPALNTAIYYVNCSDAKLLKARMLMSRGATGDFAQVISLTKDIIDNGPFVLEDSVKDIFLTKGFGSPEVMLGIQSDPDKSYKYYNYQLYPQYYVTDSLISLLANDARNQWVYKNVPAAGLDLINMLTKYYTGDPVNTALTPLSANSYVFRLSEAYLLEAEAITLSTGDLTTAKALLTTVMSRAGAGPQEMTAVANASTPAVLQLEIVKENMRNFAYENGVDWFALRRLPFAALHRINPKIIDPHQLIFPIPTSELDQNNVIQNPGY